jgi:hypothetical protein
MLYRQEVLAQRVYEPVVGKQADEQVLDVNKGA